MIARGFFGCFVLDRAGRNESVDELTKRHGGTAKKAGSAKKQRARKAQASANGGTRVITTTRGDIICVDGPGAVDLATIRKLVLRGQLVLDARDRMLLCSALLVRDADGESDDDAPECSKAAHAAMRGAGA